MNRWVEITFDCLPLRTVERLDIPIDASPKYRQRCERVKEAIEKHGSHNTYYLYNARCVFHLTNRGDDEGLLDFSFEGTVLTDPDDRTTRDCSLKVDLVRDTCPWISEPIVQWFHETVQKAVAAEFDRYIEAGDLDAAKERLDKIEQASDDSGGFVGMYL